jgi:hypothetical protein
MPPSPDRKTPAMPSVSLGSTSLIYLSTLPSSVDLGEQPHDRSPRLRVHRQAVDDVGQSHSQETQTILTNT